MANPRPRPRPFVRILAGILLLLFLAAPGLALAAGKFLVFSDLHLNPFDDQALVAELAASPTSQWQAILSRGKAAASGYGQEANYALFASTLADMRLAEPHPDFVIFTGDILAHNFNQTYQYYTGDYSQSGLEAFIAKTVTFFAQQVEQSFPGAEVYISLGNNDAYEGDYLISAGGSFLQDSSQIFAQHFLSDQGQRSEFLSQYPAGGYYSLKPASDSKLMIISVNSVFFSVNRPAGSGGDPGSAELDWLEGELKAAEASGERVFLLAHIPPGVNVYNTIHDSANTQDSLAQGYGFWNTSANARFLDLVTRYYQTIVSIFSGHTHMDDFRLVVEPSQSVEALAYIHINPAVSPQFGNNPAFQVFSYDPASGALQDFTTHYLDVGTSQPLWRGEYSFSQAYGEQGLNPASARRVFEDMAHDERARDFYKTYYKVSNQVSPFKDAEFKAYWCGIVSLDAGYYQSCYNCEVQSATGDLCNSCSR